MKPKMKSRDQMNKEEDDLVAARKEYPKQNAMELDEAGGYFMRHLSAMTSEKLHGKFEIAEQLAWRDKKLDETQVKQDQLDVAEDVASAALAVIQRMGHTYHCAMRQAVGDGECLCGGNLEQSDTMGATPEEIRSIREHYYNDRDSPDRPVSHWHHELNILTAEHIRVPVPSKFKGRHIKVALFDKGPCGDDAEENPEFTV